MASPDSTKVFPAHAGMSPARNGIAGFDESFPRTRGDEPDPSAVVVTAGAFSPHTRG